VSELKSKYKRQPNQKPPKKKGNVDIISQLVNDETVNAAIQESVNTEKKKATFLLDAGLHKI
jgi:uncharacterized ferredoxin-like protein